MAKGYVIVTELIKDPAGMAEYGKAAGKAMAAGVKDRKSTRQNSSHPQQSRMPSSA